MSFAAVCCTSLYSLTIYCCKLLFLTSPSLSSEHELEVVKLQKELSGFKEKAGGLAEMCTQYKAQIEKLLIENATLRSQLTAVENRQEMNKTCDVRRVTCTG